MHYIQNSPPPCASTTLRAPQAHLNARRIQRETLRRLARHALTALCAAGVMWLAIVVADIFITAVSASTAVTTEQAQQWRAM